MKEWKGWHFPDGETHLIEWMKTMKDLRAGRPVYQGHKYDAALAYTRKRRTAVDIGANVGLWSWLMTRDFETVHAFEPVPAYADCWRLNVAGATLHQMALGEKAGRVSMVCMTPGSCGDTTVSIGQKGEQVGQDVEMQTLDAFALADVDLIKCDNEGFELFVMRGAAQTIKRCRPVVIVEQKPGHGKRFGLSDTAAVEYLRSELSMKLQREISGDFILSY